MKGRPQSPSGRLVIPEGYRLPDEGGIGAWHSGDTTAMPWGVSLCVEHKKRRQESGGGRALAVAVQKPAAMKPAVYAKLRSDSRALPQMPCPDVQPLPSAAPAPMQCDRQVESTSEEYEGRGS